jgi:Tfp pilus assembly protein PilP
MLRPALMALLLVAACTKGPEADLQYISEARSLAAEWAMVNEQAAQGKLTGTYVATMRQSVREQLRTASQSLSQPNSRYGEEIAALLDQPDDSAPEELRAHADKLKQIEDSLESA